jgi:ABC-type amino acid transport substrate-binding protein
MKKGYPLIFLFLIFSNLGLHAKIKEQKFVTIQTSIYQPYVDVDKNGKVIGISISIANEIFKAIGYNVKYNVVPYMRATHNLFNIKNAIMMGLFEGVPEYQSLNISEIKYTVFPTTYFYNSKGHPEYGNITTVKQTKNKIIAVVGGTGIYEKAISSTGGIPELVTNEIQTLKMLHNNRVDFAHTGLLSGLHAISRNKKFYNLRPLNISITNLTSGMMFRKSTYDIRDKFLKKTKEFHKNGRLLQIYRKSLTNIPKEHAANMIPKEILMNVNSAKDK